MPQPLPKTSIEDPLTPHPQTLFSLKGIVAMVVLALVTFFAALIGFLSNKPMPADQPLRERSSTQTSCTGRTGTSLQTCCEDELIARNEAKAACLGKWEIKNDACQWICTTNQ